VRVPLSWLGEFVTWSGSAEVLVERLTLAGPAVEGVEELGRLDRRIRVGRLTAVEPHPGAERLGVCRVDVGDASPIVVVSGAPGLAAGQCVPVALPGARLPAGRETRVAAFGGIESAGVLCSEAELELGDDASQVLLLPHDTAPGTPLVEVAGIADTVLEVEVTSNRGDCLSMLGVAREVAATSGVRLRRLRPRPREGGTPAAGDVRVRVESTDLCPRYCARLVRAVTVQPSPLWLRLRLRRAGMRPVNVVVDATNHVMLERGQPLHAFDWEQLAERLTVVRRAATGERLVTLDGVERILDPADLVIADARGPVALAGVMGGQASEVTAATRALLLESAFFMPAAVRRTARRTGVASEAAYRFERRVDPAMVPEALDCAAALITRLAGGRTAPGIVEDPPGGWMPEAPTIRLRPRRVAALLGVAVPRAQIGRRLRALGATCRADRDALMITPPSHRGDLRCEEDLAEEVARLGGYDAIPVSLPEAPLASGEDSRARVAARRLRRLFAAEGLAEMVTLAFTDAETNRLLPGYVGRTLTPLALQNPLSSETGELRRSPLAGLVRALRANVGLGADFVGAFEIGKGYGVDAHGHRQEPRAVAILLYGTWPPRGVERAGPSVEFADLKGIVENVLAGLGLDERRVRWRPIGEEPFLHPGKAAVIEAAGATIGVAGALHPKIAQACDLAEEVWLSELDFETLADYGSRRVELRPLPRFPAVTRDLAVIVDEAFPAAAILEEIRSLADPRIESVRLFDCYHGTPVPPGKKSLAYSIAYRAPDRTLTDEEVSGVHAGVLQRLRERFRLELRS